MVKHFCDKCGNEGVSAVVKLNDEPRLFIDIIVKEQRKRRRVSMGSKYELCNDCYEKYVIGLAELLPPLLDKKERLVKGPHGDEWINDSSIWD